MNSSFKEREKKDPGPRAISFPRWDKLRMVESRPNPRRGVSLDEKYIKAGREDPQVIPAIKQYVYGWKVFNNLLAIFQLGPLPSSSSVEGKVKSSFRRRLWNAGPGRDKVLRMAVPLMWEPPPPPRCLYTNWKRPAKTTGRRGGHYFNCGAEIWARLS